MFSRFQKVISSVMALLLLLSTVSWTLDKHICLGRVVDVALFSKAKDCGMAAAMAAFENEAIENSCCDDESVTIHGQDDLKITYQDVNIAPDVFTLGDSPNYLNIDFGPDLYLVLNEYYPPPKIVKDIQLLDEVFLI